MTNIEAAIGLAQLERISEHLERRKAIAEGYDRRLSNLIDCLILPTTQNWATHSYWMYTVILRNKVSKSRDQVMQDLDEVGQADPHVAAGLFEDLD